MTLLNQIVRTLDMQSSMAGLDFAFSVHHVQCVSIVLLPVIIVVHCTMILYGRILQLRKLAVYAH